MTQLIPDIIHMAKIGSGKLFINGYVTQTGQVGNYKLRLLPSDAYDKMVSQSASALRKKLECGDLFAEQFDIPEGEVTAEDLHTWAGEQLAAWDKRINTSAAERDTRSLSAGLDRIEDNIYTKEGSTDFILLGLELLELEITTPGSVSEGKWGKSRVKKAIASKMPIGKYIGRMNLNVDTVTRGIGVLPA